MAQQRMLMVLLSSFAGLALVLGVLGIYSVLSVLSCTEDP